MLRNNFGGTLEKPLQTTVDVPVWKEVTVWMMCTTSEVHCKLHKRAFQMLEMAAQGCELALNSHESAQCV